MKRHLTVSLKSPSAKARVCARHFAAIAMLRSMSKADSTAHLGQAAAKLAPCFALVALVESGRSPAKLVGDDATLQLVLEQRLATVSRHCPNNLVWARAGRSKRNASQEGKTTREVYECVRPVSAPWNASSSGLGSSPDELRAVHSSTLYTHAPNGNACLRNCQARDPGVGPHVRRILFGVCGKQLKDRPRNACSMGAAW